MIDKVIGFALTQRMFVCFAGLVLLFGGSTRSMFWTSWPIRIPHRP